MLGWALCLPTSERNRAVVRCFGGWHKQREELSKQQNVLPTLPPPCSVSCSSLLPLHLPSICSPWPAESHISSAGCCRCHWTPFWPPFPRDVRIVCVSVYIWFSPSVCINACFHIQIEYFRASLFLRQTSENKLWPCFSISSCCLNWVLWFISLGVGLGMGRISVSAHTEQNLWILKHSMQRTEFWRGWGEKC